MKDCEHLNQKKKRTNYLFLGANFPYNATLCTDCGASLWDVAREKAFNSWLVKLYKEEQYRFQIQIGLPKSSSSCIEELSRKYLGAPKSSILKALTIIYMELMDNLKFEEVIKEVISREVYQSFQDTKKERYKVLFRPFAMINIQSISELTNRTPNKFVEDSVLKILSLFIEKDPALKEFWEKEIKSKLETMLKAS